MRWGTWRTVVEARAALRIIYTAISIVLGLLPLSHALAAPGDTGTANAQSDVAVLSALSFINIKDMDFGKIGGRATPGTVVIDPVDGSCSTTGAIIHAGRCQAAEFGGMGTRSFYVRIHLPNAANLQGPGATMRLDNFTLDGGSALLFAPNGNGNGNGNRRYKIVSATGVFAFNLGATLHVNANQAPGVYQGTFNVQVNYQ